MTPVTLQEFDAIAAAHPYRAKGMFYSEVFLFLEACSRMGVELIIESGVKRGMSTTLLASAWPGELISIDIARPKAELPARVDFIHGDSTVIIPALMREHDSWRVGVLIDGPKRDGALALMRTCLRLGALVVGVHDVPRWLDETRHSRDPIFRLAAGRQLDRFVTREYRAKYPDGAGLGIWERS